MVAPAADGWPAASGSGAEMPWACLQTYACTDTSPDNSSTHIAELREKPNPSRPAFFFALPSGHLNITILAQFHDDSNTVTSDFDQGKPITTKTTWTLLLYLTSEAGGCRGGETVFFPNDRQVAKEEVAVAPETGMVLLHKHGNDCMLLFILARRSRGHCWGEVGRSKRYLRP
ncbi:hypothetical protein diail_5206 [Diaporthe ilicicola]|nr:hypothetical protein diail_5206 [Diaporthe ilicicola]